MQLWMSPLPVSMRVISLVPSLTETLIEAGVNVVGRTRFCVHPFEKIQNIPSVGGTKELNFEKISKLQADLMIMDREENTKEMAELFPGNLHVTHVNSLESLGQELQDLGKILNCAKLNEFASRTFQIVNRTVSKPTAVLAKLMSDSSVFISTAHTDVDLFLNTPLIYIIWKNPWMCVGKNTFVESVFKKLGLESSFNAGIELVQKVAEPQSSEKYPKFNLEQISDSVNLLFSSEPYPFAKKQIELAQFPNPKFIVDGERFSWFGIRSITFLETVL